MGIAQLAEFLAKQLCHHMFVLAEFFLCILQRGSRAVKTIFCLAPERILHYTQQAPTSVQTGKDKGYLCFLQNSFIPADICRINLVLIEDHDLTVP